jgi:hypothetical protein
MRNEEKLIENHTPFTMVRRNPFRNLKSENSQDYAQKPQQNCTFMNSASVDILMDIKWIEVEAGPRRMYSVNS